MCSVFSGERERGSERACPVCAPAEGRINNSPVAGRLQCLVMIIGARGVNGAPVKVYHGPDSSGRAVTAI